LNFSYFLPTKIIFGYGTIASLKDEVASFGVTRVLLVTDKVMVKNGLVAKVKDNLQGVSMDVFDEVEPEPRLDVAQAVGEKARGGDYGLVIGLGGGSSIDMAKVAAGMARNPGPALDFVGNNRFKREGLPTVMLPTTAGTGAELTVTSMVTVEGHKQWINSPFLIPSVALVDPEFTLTMPASVTAATGLDALCHNTEAYLSANANVLTDSAALEGIALVVANLEKAYANGGDREAREAMSLGALLGGVALSAKMVYGHSIGYTIATRFRLPHGVSCGVPLPYIISNYAIACAPKMRKLAEAFGVVGDPEDAAGLGVAIGQKVVSLLRALKVPTSLKELGVKEEELSELAAECLAMYPRPNSPLVFDKKSMTHFYMMMWDGETGLRR
jgi:alcohol dehydrogenase class IV